MSYYADGRRFEEYALMGVVLRAQTAHENAGSHELEADNSWGDRLASLEVVLYWLGCAVAVAFIALAVIEPERVERTLTPSMFKASNIQIANVGRSAVETGDDQIEQIDAEHKFEVIEGLYGDAFAPTSAPQVTDGFGSQSQTDITGSAPIPTSSAGESIDIDPSLAIEFPVAAYQPHKSTDAMKQPPLRRAKEVAAKRSVSNNPQANSADSKPIEQPPSATSAY
jgi:hypothetical protein